MKNKGFIITIIILIICILGLSSYIVYDKITNIENNENKEEQDNTINNKISSPKEFINEISKTEKMFETQSAYTVNYEEFSFTATKNEYNHIENITIKYKDKQINKDLSMQGEFGLKGLNTYYFDEETGLFILALEITPVADRPIRYIVAFDDNGNIKLDEAVNYDIEVDVNDKTLTYHYSHPGGIGDCYEPSMGLDVNYIAYSNITYKYENNEIKEISKTTKYIKDLPKCE